MSANRELATRRLQQHFRAYNPRFSTRPDGSVLVDLRGAEGERLVMRVLHKEEQESEILLDNLVERIRRDLLAVEGPLQPENVDSYLKRIELRTFVTDNPQHRARKVVVAGARLRAMARRALEE